MKQITLIAKPSPGLLADISAALAAENINIETLDAESVNEQGVLILTVDQYDQALKVISQLEDVQAVSEDAILIALPDAPGSLAKIAKRFKDAQIGIRSIRIISREQGRSIVAISTERSADALQLVEDVLIS